MTYSSGSAPPHGGAPIDTSVLPGPDALDMGSLDKAKDVGEGKLKELAGRVYVGAETPKKIGTGWRVARVAGGTLGTLVTTAVGLTAGLIGGIFWAVPRGISKACGSDAVGPYSESAASYPARLVFRGGNEIGNEMNKKYEGRPETYTQADAATRKSYYADVYKRVGFDYHDKQKRHDHVMKQLETVGCKQAPEGFDYIIFDQSRVLFWPHGNPQVDNVKCINIFDAYTGEAVTDHGRVLSALRSYMVIYDNPDIKNQDGTYVILHRDIGRAALIFFDEDINYEKPWMALQGVPVNIIPIEQSKKWDEITQQKMSENREGKDIGPTKTDKKKKKGAVEEDEEKDANVAPPPRGLPRHPALSGGNGPGGGRGPALEEEDGQGGWRPLSRGDR